MGHSSLLGIERAPAVPAGRDNAALGPGDSSDSGSDLAGLDALDRGDPSLPVDAAMRDDASRSLMSPDAMTGGASDSSGTGERRSAGNDAGSREAADIGVDRVFSADGEAADEAEDADLAFVDQAADDGSGIPDEDEEEDEEEDVPGKEPFDPDPADVPNEERQPHPARRG